MVTVKRLVPKTNAPPPVAIVPVGKLPSSLAVLLYGRSGTGKTTISATFPKPLYLLDVREKGTDSIANVEGVDVSQIEEWEQFEDIYWWLEKGGHGYQTVVIDQITQLQDLAISKCMDDGKKEAGDVISKRIWGQSAGMMKTWLLNYRDLIDKGVNIVFIAHDRSDGGSEDADDQIDPSVGARVMPSVASFVNGSVKFIGNTFIRETSEIVGNKRKRRAEYGMRIGPHALYTTKTRSPVGFKAPEVLMNPSYDSIVAVMRGEYEEPKATPVKRIIKKGK